MNASEPCRFVVSRVLAVAGPERNGMVAESKIGDFGGGESQAFAINHRGIITGTARTASGEWHAFIRGSADAQPPTPVVPADGTPTPSMPPGSEITVFPASSG